MRKALLIVNPSSGQERAKNYEGRAKKKLQDLFDSVEVKYTEKAGDGERFARQAAREKFHSVFTMGGDGTVHEAINGLAGEENPPRYGALPFGTVNDLDRSLNLSMNPAIAIEQIQLDRYQKVDIGKVNDQYFAYVLAIGNVPEAVNQTDVEEKRKFGRVAYIFNAVKDFNKNDAKKYRLITDGKEEIVESTLFIFGLQNSIGGRENFFPGAKHNDGLIHMLYFKDKKIIDTLRAGAQLLTGVEESTDRLEYRTIKEGRLENLEGEPSSVNVDGDVLFTLPIDIKVLPQRLEMYCGPQEKDRPLIDRTNLIRETNRRNRNQTGDKRPEMK